MKFFSIPLALLSIAVAALYNHNPVLFGQRTGQSHEGLTVYTEYAELDEELAKFKDQLSSDYNAYHNHCLRVLTFTKHFLPEWVTKEDQIPNAMELAAIAIAYHDIALWSDGALDYLDPSAAQLEKHMEGKEFTDKDMAIMKEIILQHHKVTEFKSDLGEAADALINAVRKADWTDFSMGVIRFGLPIALVEAALDKLSEADFHMILNGLLPKLSPDSLSGQLAVLNIYKW